MLPEPPPVWVEAVTDVQLPMTAGLEVELDAFYTQLLPFVRSDGDPPRYEAENVAIGFVVHETPPDRGHARPTMMKLRHFVSFVTRLQEDQVPFDAIRGIGPGDDAVLLRDPAGNWLQIFDWRDFG